MTDHGDDNKRWDSGMRVEWQRFELGGEGLIDVSFKDHAKDCYFD